MSKRRGQGEGSIRERSRGRWEARYRASDGRLRSIYTRTRREAVEQLRAALAQREQGIRPPDTRVILAVFLADWLEDKRQNVRPRTAESYESAVRLYIVPSIGDVPLAKLQPEHVTRMLADLSASGHLSATTIRMAYAVLRSALAAAMRRGKVVRNVATLTDPPRRNGREIHPLSREQVHTFLDGMRGDAREALYVAAIGTGLRQGELLALRWQDVDLVRGELRVRHSLGRFTRELAETKTERSRRMLRMPPRVVLALNAHRERQTVVPMSGLVFSTADGSPLHSVNVTLGFQRALRRLGLPRRRFHDLRHTFATLALEAGEDLAMVSRALGHASVAITADTYMHVTPAMRDRLAARMEAVLSA